MGFARRSFFLRDVRGCGRDKAVGGGYREISTQHGVSVVRIRSSQCLWSDDFGCELDSGREGMSRSRAPLNPWNRGRSSPAFGCDDFPRLVAWSAEPFWLIRCFVHDVPTPLNGNLPCSRRCSCLPWSPVPQTAVRQRMSCARKNFGTLVESMPSLPTPGKLSPTGSGIVSFVIDVDGRAHSIELVCESSESAGSYLKGMVSALRFRRPSATDGARRHVVGLSVDRVYDYRSTAASLL